jgi:hypothetical protein
MLLEGEKDGKSHHRIGMQMIFLSLRCIAREFLDIV